MRRSVVSAVTAVAVLIPLAVGANAAPKTLCKIMTDAKDDATLILGGNAAPNEPSYDILSADFASNAGQIAMVVRVAKLAESVQTSPEGSIYMVNFNIPGNPALFSLRARFTVEGKSFRVVKFTSGDPVFGKLQLGAAEGIFDLKNNEVRVWAPHSALGDDAKFPKGAKATNVHAVTGRLFTASLTEDPADKSSVTTYTGGAKSCLQIGR